MKHHFCEIITWQYDESEATQLKLKTLSDENVELKNEIINYMMIPVRIPK